MRVRFNKDLPNSTFSHKSIVLEFRTADGSDLSAWYKSSGVQIPPEAIYHKDGVTRIDRKKLDIETARSLEVDDDRFIGSRIISTSGIQDHEGQELNISEIEIEQRGEMVVALRESIPEFDVFCAVFIDGAKKKSGRVELMERDLEP